MTQIHKSVCAAQKQNKTQADQDASVKRSLKKIKNSPVTKVFADIADLLSINI